MFKVTGGPVIRFFYLRNYCLIFFFNYLNTQILVFSNFNAPIFYNFPDFIFFEFLKFSQFINLVNIFNL